MRRGEVWVANLNPNRGAEVGKIRPVLILQSDRLGPGVVPTVVVLPMTSRIRPVLRHLRISIPPRDRLQAPSQVIVEQPRTLDRNRVGDGPLTRLTEAELTAVERALKAVLGFAQ
jgi:mRNA interferase MazF